MTAPDYGAKHKAARRAALARLQDGDPCCRCRKPMYRYQSRFLDLDHIDGTANEYRGLAHRTCNRRSGAVKGNQARGRMRHAFIEPLRPPWRSREW